MFSLVCYLNQPQFFCPKKFLVLLVSTTSFFFGCVCPFVCVCVWCGVCFDPTRRFFLFLFFFFVPVLPKTPPPRGILGFGCFGFFFCFCLCCVFFFFLFWFFSVFCCLFFLLLCVVFPFLVFLFPSPKFYVWFDCVFFCFILPSSSPTFPPVLVPPPGPGCRVVFFFFGWVQKGFCFLCFFSLPVLLFLLFVICGFFLLLFVLFSGFPFSPLLSSLFVFFCVCFFFFVVFFFFVLVVF